MYTNAQSIINKLPEFESRVRSENPHLIAITESWGDINASELMKLDTYKIYKQDRIGNRGGGVAIYVHESLESYECDDENISKHKFKEHVWCYIKLKGTDKLLIGCIYRSTNTTVENDEELLDLIKISNRKRESHTLIMGDFNLPGINWVEESVHGGIQSIEYKFLECIRDCYLNQHITMHTRFRRNESATLDLVITEEENIIDLEVDSPLGKSDHVVLKFKYVCYLDNLEEYKDGGFPKYIYYKGDYEKMSQMLMGIDWENELNGKTVEEMWNKYKKIMYELYHQCIPVRAKRKKMTSKPPWMNVKASRAVRRKFFAFRRWQESKSSQMYNEYIKERNKATKAYKKAKKEFEGKIAKEAGKNPKAFYKYANSKLKVKTGIGKVKAGEGKMTETDEETAEMLNNFFQTVFIKEEGRLPNFDKRTEDKLENFEIFGEQVKKILEQLNENKSCGRDNIHACVLKNTAEASSIPLTIIFKESLMKHEVPTDWKVANISAIHKKGSMIEVNNYRPVSLTSQVCRVMEKIIRSKIIEHLKKNNLIHSSQHGFRNGRSCLTNLLEVLEDWTKIIDEGSCIDILYLDLKKAFDTVPHQRLLLKLKAYGIDGKLHGWIKSFLVGRTQQVVVRKQNSRMVEVESGVPQGSVIGPILFLIYINDMSEGLENEVKLFADDAKIYSRIEHERDSESLQRDLNKLNNVWSKDWLMNFNVEKCKRMHIGSKNQKFLYNMAATTSKEGVEILKESTEEKDLGVVIDNELKFNKHIQGIVKNANRTLGLIRKTFEELDKETFLLLYFPLVRSKLEYCVQAWSPSLKKDQIIIEQVQRRATKLIPELREFTYKERLQKLGLTTLYQRRLRGDAIEVYKLLTGLEDIDYKQFMQLNERENTRGHHLKLWKNRCRLNTRKYFFSQRVVDMWNGLPEDVVSAKSVSSFKKRLDKCWKNKDVGIQELYGSF